MTRQVGGEGRATAGTPGAVLKPERTQCEGRAFRKYLLKTPEHYFCS